MEPWIKVSKTDHPKKSLLSNNVIVLATSKYPFLLSYLTIFSPLAFNKYVDVIYCLQDQ